MGTGAPLRVKEVLEMGAEGNRSPAEHKGSARIGITGETGALVKGVQGNGNPAE